MTLYLISGLGADSRVFNKLTFPSNFKVIYIEWLPVIKNESIVEYCSRLARGIDTRERFIIIGLSFGGIVAIELSKMVKPEKVILISSVSSRKEIPKLYRTFGYLKLIRIVPNMLFKRVNFITYYLFGLKTKEEKSLLQAIIQETDIEFLRWAIGVLITWSNEVKPDNVIHIHGTNDKLLPISLINADVKVIDGGHLMIYSRAKETSKILTEVLGYS